MPHRPASQPAADRRSVREQALRTAALELFTQRGYEATTMADIGAAIGIRGPSLYKYVSSKQDLLAQVMTQTMDNLLALHRKAVAGTEDVTQRLRRAAETHVRYHARHRQEAFVGNRELRHLREPHRRIVLGKRAAYEGAFRAIIEDGLEQGRFHVASARLASYAILDLGMGVAVWYREDGEHSEDEVVYQYGDFALRLVGAVGA